MIYTDFLSIITMLTSQLGFVLTGIDGITLVTLPSAYEFTLLDMLLGALISEELLAFVMEF